jgi:holo-[acyl-carrier protein] synthase
MIGIDITKISRFADDSDRMADKILTEDELSEYEKSQSKLNYLAGRWAAKEATFKATGLDKVSILSEDSGKPYVKDHEDIFISISHDYDYAIAVAVRA